MIGLAAALLIAGQAAPAPVQFWKQGDDGATNRLFDGLTAAGSGTAECESGCYRATLSGVIVTSQGNAGGTITLDWISHDSAVAGHVADIDAGCGTMVLETCGRAARNVVDRAIDEDRKTRQ